MSAGQPGLTSFKESANQVEVTQPAPANIEREISQPYDVDVPHELLTRNYLVNSTSWTSLTSTIRIDFPSALASITAISDVMKRFKYFRATVHVEIKLSTTPYHQGSLMVGWLPCPGTGVNALALTSAYVSGFKGATVLSAATQDSVSFDIPYLHPLDWLDWPAYSATSAHSSLFITPLNQLVATTANITASCPILIYASFKDVQVTGYRSQSKQITKFEKNEESANKQKNGIDTKSIVSTISKVARKMPVVGEIWNPIADTINAFAGNLSKPLATAATQPILHQPFSEGNHATGLDVATQLSLYPNAQITRAPMMFGMDTSHLPVVTIAQTPMLHLTGVLNGTITSLTTVVSPNARSSTTGVRDYCNAVTRNFCFWRGSIKYLIHFCMPAFYQLRVQLSVQYEAAPSNIGDLTSRIVDIKGNTWEEVTVPYLFPTPWMSTDEALTYPKLVITQLTTILGSSAPASPIVYVNVFRAAGEDYQLSVPRSINNSQPIDAVESIYHDQMMIGTAFQRPFETLTKGTSQSVELRNCMPEQAGTVSDLLKRTTQILWAAPYTVLYTPDPNVTTGDLFNCMLRFFMFWRGSRVVTRIPGAGGMIYLNTSASTPGDSEGYSVHYSDATPMFVTEKYIVPYYCKQYYYPLPLQSSLLMHLSAYSNVPMDAINGYADAGWHLSAGDDLTLLFLHPLNNNLIYTALPETAKKKGIPTTTKEVLPTIDRKPSTRWE